MPEPITPETPKPEAKPVNIFDLDTLLDYEAHRAPAAETPPPPPPPAEPAKVKHSRAAVLAGREVGLDPAQMEGMTDDELTDEIYLRKQRMLAEEAREAKGRAAVRVKEEAEANIPLDFGGAKLDDVDDEIKKALEHLARENAALKAQVAQQQEVHVRQQAQTVSERLDALFGGNPEVFGTGPSARLNPRGKESARRNAVIGHLMQLNQSGLKTTLEADFKAACEALGYDAAPVAQAQAPAPTKEQWDRAGLARPAARTAADPPKGEARAASAIQRKLEENGVSLHGNAKIEDFPD
jgi:hypothetical protein